MTPQKIVVDGYDGTMPEDTSTNPVVERLRVDMDKRHPEGWFDRYEANDRAVCAEVVQLFEYHLALPHAVRAHNDAVLAAQEYARASVGAERAAAEAEELYRDLNKNTTVNWLAAHHRYMLAVTRARKSLTARLEAARALDGSGYRQVIVSRTKEIYEAAVPAGQRLVMPDLDAVQLELTEFVEKTRDRIEILRATVTGGYPEGFEPAADPAPAGPAVPGVDDDWSADWPASVAVVSGERRW